MVDATSTGLKRPLPNDSPQDGGSAQKKSRSNNGSPAPQANGSSVSKPDVSKLVADARSRAAAVAARLQSSRTGVHGATPNQVPVPGTTAPASKVPMSRLEEMRARVAALTQKGTDSPAPASAYQTPALTYDDGILRARGGLSAALHPSLLDSSKDASSSKGKQAIQSKFPTTMANQRPQSPATHASKSGNKKQLDLSGPSAEETRSNPYFDASLGAQTATLKSRNAKQLIFNQKGKYIQQAAALRRQANLELTKKKIAESIKKAGLQDDPTEQNFRVPEPTTEVEWWDENLVNNGKDYASGFKIDTTDTIITSYVQHPVLLEPAQSRLAVQPKELYLTPKERAKLRRQRRMADLKEVQAKQRLGLEPVPAPKVKLGNLMRVLGEEAVKDPTAVEARVNREIAERANKHDEMNENRKLGKEEKHEKLERQKAEDAAKGIHCLVFRIDSLANGRHRFKIMKNGEQASLTGVVCIGKKFSVVIAEGGLHSVNAYKKLMLTRIDWTENSPAPVREGNKQAQAAWLENQDEQGNLKDLGFNKCELLFEGEQAGRQFRKWGQRVVESDKEAMECLGRGKMENFWTMAKSVP